MVSTQFRNGLAALTLLLGCPAANAQNYSGACQRLETQLAGLDRGANDGARAEQVRRYEEAVSKQQDEIDRLNAQSQRMGCERNGFFQLFNPNQNPKCGPLSNQIQQLRGNLNRTLSDLQSLQRSTAGYERDSQRRAILAALAQNDCGPQYRSAAAQPRNFFESLLGTNQQQDYSQGDSYRTVCVRTCDGFYYPISFSTTPARFEEDERTCQRMCPASEVMLFSYRNPGGDISQATSVSGQPYTALPNAFKYRQQFDNACSCKGQSATWADAMKGTDERGTAQPGDILVTDERSKAMAQPRDAKGKLIRSAAPKIESAPLDSAPASTTAAAGKSSEPPEPAPVPTGPIRTVGPQLGPVR
jgi:hypothetical protein